MYYDREKLDTLDHRFRVALINSLSGFKSANLVGTVNREGNTNLSIVSSVVHLGADPALMGFVVRPHSVDRHTLENVLETRFFTLNQVAHSFYRQAHQTSARYPRSKSEFDEAGLGVTWQEGFAAPYVSEARIRLGMEFREHHHLAINGTEFLIGEIREIHLPDDCIAADGYVDLEKAATVCVSGLDSYHRTQRLSRLSYAKPGREPHSVNWHYSDEPSISGD